MCGLCVRSLLEGSDTISIDTTVVSSQEFGCLLDMVYTGKLPVGKHNVSRIVAAADSLQMFDVAVGFKKVLATLVKQQQPPPPAVVQLVPGPTPAQTPTLHASSPSQTADHPERVQSPNACLDSTELEKEHTGGEDRDQPEDKRARVEPSESTGQNQLCPLM